MSTPDLCDLQRFIEKWGHSTHEGRLNEHLTSSFEELEAFHQAFTPRLRELIVDQQRVLYRVERDQIVVLGASDAEPVLH